MVTRTGRHRRGLLLVMCGAAGAAAVGLAACSSSSDANGESEFVSSPDATGPGTDAAWGVGGGEDGFGGPIPGDHFANVRFANLAPGLGSVDFCWAPTDGVDYRGPVLGTVDDAGIDADADAGADAETDADADAAQEAGAGFPRTLAYQSFAMPHFLVDDAVLDIIAIPAGRACDAPPLASAHFGTLGGYSTTIVLTSLPGSPGVAGLFAVTDDPFSLASDAPYLRVVNAALLPDVKSLGAAVTVDGTTTSLGTSIVPGSTSPAVDGGDPTASGSGYVRFAPTSSEATLALTFDPADAGLPPVSISLGSPLVAKRFSTAFVGRDAQGFFVALSDDSTINESGSSYVVLR